LIVQSIETLAGKHDTFNFEVADFHTYFVGKQGAWVYNTCQAISSFKSMMKSNGKSSGSIYALQEAIKDIGYNLSALKQAKHLLQKSIKQRQFEFKHAIGGGDMNHQKRITLERKLLDKINRTIRTLE
jgi:hypothetical protein